MGRMMGVIGVKKKRKKKKKKKKRRFCYGFCMLKSISIMVVID